MSNKKRKKTNNNKTKKLNNKRNKHQEQKKDNKKIEKKQKQNTNSKKTEKKEIDKIIKQKSFNKEKNNVNEKTKYKLNVEDIIEYKVDEDFEDKYDYKKENKDEQKSKEKSKQKKKSNNRIKKKIKIKNIIIFILMIITIAILLILIIQKKERRQILEAQEKLLEQIESHYNEYVITKKEVDIYELKNDKYEKVGKIGKEEELTLTKKYITYKDEYFEIKTFKDKYYIHYKDVKKIDFLKEIKKTEQRYKKYIPFNINIITKNITNFYNEENDLIYSFNKSFELPVIIKKDNLYGVEYNNKLLYVKKEDIKETKNNKNTDKENTKGIAVLNYHFFNNSDDPSDSCNQIICLSTNNLKKHLEYIKDNNIFTPSMKELEMYIDGFIQLPKSVVLTIDDGWRAKIGSEVMAKYEINATIFLMSKYYDPRNYQNDYIEVHSHGYDIHNGGMCPGGQGGEIKCMEKTKLLEDLKQSRDKLNNTTYFCYPFYEYNDYSISVLKEAGFTMAFGGTGEGGNYKVKPGINKFKLPRYVIYNYTTANTIATYID